MLTLDTSGLVTLMYRKDSRHRDVVSAFDADAGPHLIPVAIMAEIAYILEQRLGMRAFLVFLADVRDGAYTLDCGDSDVPRIEELVRRYADLPLGFADAAVIACGERRGGNILTTDTRHFSVVARGERSISLFPVS